MCNNCNSRIEVPTVECSCDKKQNMLNSLEYLHRELIETVAKFPGFEKLEPRTHYELIVNATRAYFANMGYVGLQFVPFEQEFAVISEIQSMSSEDYLQKLVNQGQVSIQGEQILRKVITFLNEETKPKFLHNNFRILRGYVKNMTTLPKSEQNSILVALQLAEGSVGGWREIMRNKKHPFYRTIRDHNLTLAMLVGPDFWGGLANCVICSEAGPVGCIGCAGASSGWASTWFATSAL
jgi:hypothetical protein